MCQVWVFVVWLLFNKWDKQTKKSSYFGGIHVGKLGTYLIKDFTNIGMELVCNFSKTIYHWKQYVTK